MSLFSVAKRCTDENIGFAIIHIMACRGSTPRHNASMILTQSGEMAGTIGGGMMERMVIDEARQAIEEGKSRPFYGRMTRQGAHSVGADCGGAMTVFIAVYPARPTLFLLGAGHVNRAIAQAAQPLDFIIHIADTWQASLNHPDLPEACQRWHGNSYREMVARLPLSPQSYVVIATNHQDKEALSAMLNRPYRFLGLLASRRKAQSFRKQLLEQGASGERLATLHSPVGIAIGAETPEEIAISVLAEILREKSLTQAAAAEVTPFQPAAESRATG